MGDPGSTPSAHEWSLPGPSLSSEESPPQGSVHDGGYEAGLESFLPSLVPPAYFWEAPGGFLVQPVIVQAGASPPPPPSPMSPRILNFDAALASEVEGAAAGPSGLQPAEETDREYKQRLKAFATTAEGRAIAEKRKQAKAAAAAASAASAAAASAAAAAASAAAAEAVSDVVDWLVNEMVMEGAEAEEEAEAEAEAEAGAETEADNMGMDVDVPVPPPELVPPLLPDVPIPLSALEADPYASPASGPYASASIYAPGASGAYYSDFFLYNGEYEEAHGPPLVLSGQTDMDPHGLLEEMSGDDANDE
jgi:hypothetical protein